MALAAAIRAGDLATVRDLLDLNPDLASTQLGGPLKTRTALHVAADWPGYFPNGPEVVRLLIAAGADPNAHELGDETPLHWAASSDDADVASALIDGGADLETPDGSIGTPLDNAIGYRCWHVARLLVARGAVVDKLWQASALGLLANLKELLASESSHDQDALSEAFWHACAAGQRRTAELLLNAGADLNWIPEDAQETALDVARGAGTRQDNVISWLCERGAQSSEVPK